MDHFYKKTTATNNDSFLELLGAEKKPADITYLTEILHLFFKRIPFENISKIYYLKQRNLSYIADLELYLDGIAKYSFGGMCYANNYHFHNLLKYLGFDVHLIGTHMSMPNSHMANIVIIGDKEYFIDVGYAVSFPYPIPLYLNTEQEFTVGHSSYKILPRNNSKVNELKLYRDNKHVHGYIIDPTEKHIEDFDKHIKDSFKKDYVFLNSLLLTKEINNTFHFLHNYELYISTKDSYKFHKIKSKKELIKLINELFNIPLEILEFVFKKH
jgi:arylamine N-acetyltransferase